MSVEGGRSAQHDPPAPLHGVRVIEVGSFIAGPFCAAQLADLGADVVKVEQPDVGDHVRQIGPFVDGESSAFVRLNRNKQSLAVDLKTEEGKAIFRRMVRGADVVVENLRPGSMAALDLGYSSLTKLNPRLVYFVASGWGQDGVLSQAPGLDIMAQARSGLMSITGPARGGPVKVGVPICDLVCALYGALAVVAALRARDENNRGQLVDVSLFEAGVSLSVWEAAEFFATSRVPKRLGSAHQRAAPYQAVRSADGWFTVGATTQHSWRALCSAIDLPSLLSDARFLDVNARHRHRATLARLVEKVTRTEPTRHWIELLTDRGIPCAPIQDYSAVYGDRALTDREYFWDAPHPTLNRVRQLGSPMRFGATRTVRRRAGPLLGEDTAAILAGLGYKPEAIASLAARGTVKLAPAPPPRGD